MIAGGYERPQRLQIRSACRGCDAAFPTKPTGLRCAAPAASRFDRFRPHLPQNRERRGSGEAHRGHGKTPGSPGLISKKLCPPHRPQNRIPSANLAPQTAQATTPGIRLGSIEPPWLPTPADDEGLLPRTSFLARSCTCITCYAASGRISIKRSSSCSPWRETRKTCCPAGMSARTTLPDLPTLALRSSST